MEQHSICRDWQCGQRNHNPHHGNNGGKNKLNKQTNIFFFKSSKYLLFYVVPGEKKLYSRFKNEYEHYTWINIRSRTYCIIDILIPKTITLWWQTLYSEKAINKCIMKHSIYWKQSCRLYSNVNYDKIDKWMLWIIKISWISEAQESLQVNNNLCHSSNKNSWEWLMLWPKWVSTGRKLLPDWETQQQHHTETLS